MIDRTQFWLVVVLLAIGTYAIRFSFLGMLGNHPLPRWLVRIMARLGDFAPSSPLCSDTFAMLAAGNRLFTISLTLASSMRPSNKGTSCA